MLTRLFVVAVAPGVGLAMALYFNDRHDREPLSLLFKIFLMGALSIIPTFIIERVLLAVNPFTGLLGIAYTAFLVAGVTEEYIKRGVVLLGAYQSHHFNEKLDGIVYAAFAALGFATVENIMYIVAQSTGNYYVAIMRGILSVPAHMLFAITMGYYLSLAKYAEDPADRKRYMARSLYIPAYLHGLFNFILMVEIPLLMLVFIPYVAFLWYSSIVKLRAYTRSSRDGEGEWEE